jgi:signal transduction histidine kinase
MSNVYRLSKLEEDQLAFHKLDVCELLQKSIDFIELPIQDNVQITIDCPFKEIFVDANDLLQDVFENLLINAVVHNRNPIIEVLIRISKVDKDKANYVKLEFIDNGIGIIDERKINIFERERNKENGGKGMGFGLTLVKKLMDFYKGKIWIENKIQDDYSQGSNFVIILPEA